MSKTKKRQRVLGAFLAALALGVGLIYMSDMSGARVASVSNSSTSPMAVVALVDIPAGKTVTASELTLAPVATKPTGAFGQISDATSKTEYAKVEIVANEVLLPSLLTGSAATVANSTTPTAASGPSTAPDSVAATLPAGEVAISVPFDPGKAVGGYLKVGDHVDILVDINGKGQIVWAFQDVVILEVGANAGGGSVLVVEVNRNQATELAYIVDASAHGGDTSIVEYVLRPESQNGSGSLSAPQVNPSNWGSLVNS